MVIIDTIGVIVIICDERSALQCAAAGSASETVSMETLAHCLQDPICNPLPTAGTHTQRVHVAVLTLGCAITIIKLHALQGAPTSHAAETMRVEEFIHGSHCRLRSGQSLSAFTAHICSS